MSIEIKKMTEEDLAQMIKEQKEHEELNPDRPIRPDIKKALDAYASHGIPLGNFLQAVVSNNLFEAMGRADSYNRATIFQITSYVYNYLPDTCWGSLKMMHEHLRSFEAEVSWPKPDIDICSECKEHAEFKDGESNCCGAPAYDPDPNINLER